MRDMGDGLDAGKVAPREVDDDLASAGVVWRREGRPPTVGEARIYFDAHATAGGDPEILEECERILDATNHPTRSLPGSGYQGAKPAPFPRPPEDQLEEKGSD
jgi:hypothetical protein